MHPGDLTTARLLPTAGGYPGPPAVDVQSPAAGGRVEQLLDRGGGGGPAHPAVARVPRALTVAGSDSSGGAGIQADLKTFAAMRVYGASAITAVTAQNTEGVYAVHALPAELLTAQVVSVRDDIGVDAVKIGMLAQAAGVRAIAALIRAGGLGPVVLDPVLSATRGGSLLDAGGLEALRHELLPVVDVLTPNLPEAARLLDCDPAALHGVEARRAAARALTALGPRCAVIKGGHRVDAARETSEAIDVWWCASGEGGELVGRWVDTPHGHGTGCTFSAALAAGLARGWSLPAALGVAKSFVTWGLQHAPGIGRGRGPLQHLLPDATWEQWRRGAEELSRDEGRRRELPFGLDSSCQG